MMIRSTVIAIALVAAPLAAALAGPVEDLAREAEAQAKAGRQVEAVETLRRAMSALTDNGPLVLRHVQFIAERPGGFGIFRTRANNVFRPGEPLIIYAEPIGIGWTTEGDVNRALIATDFEIRTPDGKVLGGQKDFGRFEFRSHDRNQEIMTHLTITLTGAPAGSYVIEATYRDQINNKSAKLELPFEIK
jgi:hypothetical protein